MSTQASSNQSSRQDKAGKARQADNGAIANGSDSGAVASDCDSGVIAIGESKKASKQTSRHTSKHARQERNAVDVAFKGNTALANMLKRHGGKESTDKPEKNPNKRHYESRPETRSDGRSSDHKGGRRWL